MTEAERPTVTEFVADDITNFTAALVRCTALFGDAQPWWRGQREASWPLCTGLHRNDLAGKERNINARFRLKAKARYAKCPPATEPMHWLFLMQHYRLPTRLLDWTQSSLVALYFALQAPDDSDAIVWALSPTRLNKAEANASGICTPGTATLGMLGVQAFVDRGVRDERVLAVLTDEWDPRHMAQQSAFTIHGRAVPLDQAAGCEEYLARIRIPAGAKELFRTVLRLYGISLSSLFPDLESLARDVAGLEFASENLLGSTLAVEEESG